MPRSFRLLLLFLLIPISIAAAQAHYVITNDDVHAANTATFYALDGTLNAPTLTQLAVVPTGGKGHSGGYFAATGVTLLRKPQGQCIFIADSDTSDVAGIVLGTQQVTGNFRGSRQDSGGLVGIGMAMNDNYLYVSYTGTYTVATFQVLPGCQLKFLKDIDAVGRGLGTVDGMAIRNNLLVVAYADSTIESFDISAGVPKPNGDEQLSTGSINGNLPAGVDITSDGHFAIFGDTSGSTTIEVSDISSGKLAPTVVYSVGSGADSNDVYLSPDESLLYISNDRGGTVTAAFFDKTTGVVSPGCTSPVLRGFNSRWNWRLASLPP
jgi:DNA-binding beta-propeller fold protein YncE